MFVAFCGGASLLLLNPSKYIDNMRFGLLEFIKNQAGPHIVNIYGHRHTPSFPHAPDMPPLSQKQQTLKQHHIGCDGVQWVMLRNSCRRASDSQPPSESMSAPRGRHTQAPGARQQNQRPEPLSSPAARRQHHWARADAKARASTTPLSAAGHFAQSLSAPHRLTALAAAPTPPPPATAARQEPPPAEASLA
jgi:hypothetical protein